ncbi:hypothetical protein PHLGIDRAFT_130656 [Phlebiopsis gigantea 11061_1 CR5-6]|uniref:Uncharacterized protein n=1 Tax=Phlebiopsis gigantea (strain 11061_1 CR5-6) TaxID=745531 RepID=A0A0C3NDH8_PHLG1|nr:hypothetical protein PHLGIDRAFT_130656 [Phlebiopsis gigantea 11061_1 CR5-6]
MSVHSRQKTAQSQIPVIAPRPPHSSLPSSLSSPHLGLVSPGRHLAVSGSPTRPSASTHSSSSTGSTPFRSFRNFLSFGPTKSQSANSSPAASSSAGPTRQSLGSLRRSTNGERSVSSPNLPTTNLDTTPVLTIELSHKVDQPLIDSEDLQSRLCLRPRTPENSSPLSTTSTLSSRVVAVTPEQPAPYDRSPKLSDLSTILEAETSGISRHIPDFDDSKDVASSRTGRSPNTHTLRASENGAHDVSFLDLSTSGLHKEVLAALSQSGPRERWEDDVVVEDGVESPPMSPPDGIPPDVSFNLGAVDPDLAALLSPNHVGASEPALLVALDAAPSPLRSPIQIATEPNSPASPTRPLSDSKTPPHSATRSPSVPRPSSSSRPPLDRPTSLSASRLPVQSSSARLARSTPERPSFSGSDRTYLPSPAKTEESDGRPSLQLSRQRRSPLLQESPLPRPSSSHGAESDARKTAASRLATPSRHLAPLSSSTRSGVRLIPSPQSSPGYEATESTSLRSPSAVGPSVNRRFNGVRPSLDSGGADRPRTRDRSASITEGYDLPSKRPVDWLGPRTAKAFAAAGLLDGEREAAGPSISRPGSRYGYGSVRSERDFRSQYAPSRAGFSDAGSPQSWGRRSGSISHTVASSEAISSVLGTPLSDSASAPRTTFSGASTAPTSLSSSSAHRHLHDELDTLQQKHALETGVLLSALADSQRTTKMLREENAQLRDTLHYAEAQLAAAREELHRVHFAQSFNPPSTSTLGRNSIHRLAGQEPARRGYPSSRLQTILHSSSDDLRLDQTEAKNAQLNIPQQDPIPPRPSLDSASHSSSRRRRYSGTSSIFPAPPSNMTMLLHEEGFALDATAGFAHAAHASLSSAGNISPTTATFSMLTDSPGSLCLRPEHEQLLGDMPTLDLGADD